MASDDPHGAPVGAHEIESVPAPGRGRPTASQAAAKQAAILEAAAQVFLDQGFEAASMDAIARRAGVSKATLYSRFDNKVVLFAAIVEDRCRRTMPSLAPQDFVALPLRDVLARVGGDFLDLLTSKDAIPLYRMVLAAAGRFPGLGRAFFAVGPARILDPVAEYLRAASARGELAIADPALAAEHFFSIVVGNLDIQLLLGIVSRITPAERTRRVGAAVDAFLRAYAPSAPRVKP